MILLYLYMGAAAIVLLAAGLMEYQGFKQKISGANGFVWTMMVLALGTALLPVSALSWLLWDGSTALVTLVAGAAWLALIGWLTMLLMMAGARSS